PFFLDTGRHPTIPSSLGTDTNVAAASEFLRKWNISLKMAKDALVAAQERQVKYANNKRREETFEVDDLVLLSGAHINHPGESRRPTKKLSSKFLGPFRVAQIISPVAYRLDLPKNLRIHPVFHVSLLQRYTTNPPEFANREEPPPPPVITDTTA